MPETDHEAILAKIEKILALIDASIKDNGLAAMSIREQMAKIELPRVCEAFMEAYRCAVPLLLVQRGRDEVVAFDSILLRILNGEG